MRPEAFSGKVQSLFIVLTTVSLISVAAQQPSTPSTPVPQKITFSMIVTDGANRAVDSIAVEEIEVVQNKIKQKVVGVESDQRPTDIALVLDCSGSFKKLLPSSINAAKLVIDGRQDGDEIFIESFVASDRIMKVKDFTSDTKALVESLNTLYIEGGASAVIDAIHVATTHLVEHRASESRRKALIMITDGEDRASFYSKDDLVKLLRKSDVQVFVLAITSELDPDGNMLRRSPRDRAESLLKTVAQESGGRVLFPKDTKELTDSTIEIIHNLRDQFRVSFESASLEPKKGYHKFSVRLTSAREVVARPAFYFDPAQPK
jgi:Ca-activated chloride channel family protein